MTNAKNELLDHINKRVILAATISDGDYDGGYRDYPTYYAELKVGYTPNQFAQFILALDFEYDSGYGCQELYGTIWYSDGTWSSRGEYDGSEWWDWNILPDIPDNLK